MLPVGLDGRQCLTVWTQMTQTGPHRDEYADGPAVYGTQPIGGGLHHRGIGVLVGKDGDLPQVHGDAFAAPTVFIEPEDLQDGGLRRQGKRFIERVFYHRMQPLGLDESKMCCTLLERSVKGGSLLGGGQAPPRRSPVSARLRLAIGTGPVGGTMDRVGPRSNKHVSRNHSQRPDFAHL